MKRNSIVVVLFRHRAGYGQVGWLLDTATSYVSLTQPLPEWRDPGFLVGLTFVACVAILQVWCDCGSDSHRMSLLTAVWRSASSTGRSEASKLRASMKVERKQPVNLKAADLCRVIKGCRRCLGDLGQYHMTHA